MTFLRQFHFKFEEKIMKSRLIVFFSIMIAFVGEVAGEIRVGQVFIERKDVFEREDKDWFFASAFLNSLRATTKEYVVADELLFNEGETISDDYLLETERNLRSTGLFTNVKIELDSISDDTYDVYVVTKDRWSLYPAVLFGTSGGSTNLGGRLDEYNFLGTGTFLSFEALNREESNIGWQGIFELRQRRFLRSELSLNFRILSNKNRTEQNIELARHFLTLDDPYSYGVKSTNSFGEDFLFISGEGNQMMPLEEQSASAWFSRGWWRKDRVFVTALAEYHHSNRGESKYDRAFDNSGKLLFGFSSVSQDFHAVEKVNSYFLEDMNVGGWGTAMLGKVFPIGSKGNSYYYVAGQGERSYYDGRLYLFGQLTGASAFWKGSSYFTYQEFQGNAFYKVTEQLLFAANFRQQTVWNWANIRQLILDADGGLRGYALNSITGDNRIVSNNELRYYPNLEIWVLNLSGVLFWDIATAWKQDIAIADTKFHNSLGAGLRLHFSKSDNPKHMMRIDMAYNFDEKRFGGIMIGTEHYFSAFKNHSFKLPQIYGLEFDYE